MKLNVLLILIMTFLFTTSCEDDSPETTWRTIHVDLKVNELYSYDTNIGGDEEGASISTQASHFKVSEIRRDVTTKYSAVYNYQPAVDFIGTDEVEIKLSTGSDGASPSTHFEFIQITFNITE